MEFGKKEVVKEINLNEENTVFNDPENFMTLAFSPDAKNLVIGGIKKGELVVYDLEKNSVINRLSAKFSYPRTIQFDPTGKYLIMLDFWTKGLFIWETTEFQRHKAEFFNENKEKIYCFDICKTAPEKLAYGMLSSTLIVIDINSTELILRDRTAHEGRITGIAFTPDGNKLISAAEDWQVVVRNVEE